MTLLGCQKNDSISVYSVKKEKAESMISQTDREKTSLKWVLPKEWKEMAATEMRILSVQIHSLPAKSLDFSVVKLAGDGGGLLMNVNRWRNQLELPPLTESELQKVIHSQALGGFSFKIVDILSQNHQRESLVAILNLEGESYFFKLTGEKEKVEKEKSHFYEFLKGLKRA